MHEFYCRDNGVCLKSYIFCKECPRVAECPSGKCRVENDLTGQRVVCYCRAVVGIENCAGSGARVVRGVVKDVGIGFLEK